MRLTGQPSRAANPKWLAGATQNSKESPTALETALERFLVCFCLTSGDVASAEKCGWVSFSTREVRHAES